MIISLTVLVNRVTLFCHSLTAPPPNMTGRCNHHFRMNGSQLFTRQARKTVPIKPTRPIGANCAGGVFSMYSLPKTYRRRMGVLSGPQKLLCPMLLTVCCACYRQVSERLEARADQASNRHTLAPSRVLALVISLSVGCALPLRHQLPAPRRSDHRRVSSFVYAAANT